MQLLAIDQLEELLEDVRATVVSQIARIKEVRSTLETAQRSLPCISLYELALMRSGQRQVNRAAYLLGRLEGAIVDLEDVASGLEEDLGGGLNHVASVKLAAAEFRDIEGAIRRVVE